MSLHPRIFSRAVSSGSRPRDSRSVTTLCATPAGERAAAEGLKEWMPKLTHPIRGGEHFQTAFAFGLVLDWARTAPSGGIGGECTADDHEMADLVYSRIADFLRRRPCRLPADPLRRRFVVPQLRPRSASRDGACSSPRSDPKRRDRYPSKEKIVGCLSGDVPHQATSVVVQASRLLPEAGGTPAPQPEAPPLQGEPVGLVGWPSP